MRVSQSDGTRCLHQPEGECGRVQATGLENECAEHLRVCGDSSMQTDAERDIHNVSTLCRETHVGTKIADHVNEQRKRHCDVDLSRDSCSEMTEAGGALRRHKFLEMLI